MSKAVMRARLARVYPKEYLKREASRPLFQAAGASGALAVFERPLLAPSAGTERNANVAMPLVTGKQIDRSSRS
ncbi:MAG: hypothetical protein WAK03_09040 [Methylocystis sp.]|jgi:hypothetical protein